MARSVTNDYSHLSRTLMPILLKNFLKSTSHIFSSVSTSSSLDIDHKFLEIFYLGSEVKNTHRLCSLIEVPVPNKAELDLDTIVFFLDSFDNLIDIPFALRNVRAHRRGTVHYKHQIKVRSVALVHLSYRSHYSFLR